MVYQVNSERFGKLPVIFQLNIEDTDIESNRDVFYIQVAPQVSQFHADVLKNGTTIHDYWFPGCNATNQGRGNQGEYTGAHTGSGGGPENYISGVTMPFVSGDRFTFKVTSIGSAADPGQGLRFTLKCLV